MSMGKLTRKITQRKRRKALACYVCGATDAPWEYPFEDGGTIRLCEWDNSMVQTEVRGTIGLGHRVTP